MGVWYGYDGTLVLRDGPEVQCQARGSAGRYAAGWVKSCTARTVRPLRCTAAYPCRVVCTVHTSARRVCRGERVRGTRGTSSTPPAPICTQGRTARHVLRGTAHCAPLSLPSQVAEHDGAATPVAPMLFSSRAAYACSSVLPVPVSLFPVCAVGGWVDMLCVSHSAIAAPNLSDFWRGPDGPCHIFAALHRCSVPAP